MLATASRPRRVAVGPPRRSNAVDAATRVLSLHQGALSYNLDSIEEAVLEGTNGDDRFVLDVDESLETVAATGKGGNDALDFSRTSSVVDVVVNLSTLWVENAGAGA